MGVLFSFGTAWANGCTSCHESGISNEKVNRSQKSFINITMIEATNVWLAKIIATDLTYVGVIIANEDTSSGGSYQKINTIAADFQTKLHILVNNSLYIPANLLINDNALAFGDMMTAKTGENMGIPT